MKTIKNQIQMMWEVYDNKAEGIEILGFIISNNDADLDPDDLDLQIIHHPDGSVEENTPKWVEKYGLPVMPDIVKQAVENLKNGLPAGFVGGYFDYK